MEAESAGSRSRTGRNGAGRSGAPNYQVSDLEANLMSQLTAALQSEPHQDSASPPDAQAHGPQAQPAQIQHEPQSVTGAPPLYGDPPSALQLTPFATLSNEDTALIDSLKNIINSGGQLLEPFGAARSQPAPPPLPANLAGVAGLAGADDLTTLQAVQSVLEELDGGWSKQPTADQRQRIREENRNRKRRWRDAHLVRNRDNDLRARIFKRASLLFGDEASEARTKWVENEYQRRRERRILRESTELHREAVIAKVGGQSLAGGPIRPGSAGAGVRTYESNEINEIFASSNKYLMRPGERQASAAFSDQLLLSTTVPHPDSPKYIGEYRMRPMVPAPKSGVSKAPRSGRGQAVRYGFPPRLPVLIDKPMISGLLHPPKGITPPKALLEELGLLETSREVAAIENRQ